MPRARAQAANDPTRSQPLTVAALRGYGAFESFTAPGDFDPTGDWAHTYRVWLVGAARSRDAGTLRIQRSRGRDGAVILQAVSAIRQATQSTQEVRARVVCAPDALCTPRDWELESVLLDAESNPVEMTRMVTSGQATERGISVEAGERTWLHRLSRPFTTNWSLFEAVQRLPRGELKPLQFALLEDLELVKPGQRLSSRETVTENLGGNPLTLHEYVQVGEGILPYHYWVDDHGRLLVVISGVRAYILGSAA